jgi:hypothetical protein
MDNLVHVHPAELLIHGPSKLLIDQILFHEPRTTIVASYRPKARDVEDHFGLFRGVDQIESFGQTLGAASVYIECVKQNLTPSEFKQRFTPTFISLGNVHFHSFLKAGDTFVNIAHIDFYKFRQMVGGGRIYKAPEGLDLNQYFQNVGEQKLRDYDLDNGFGLVAEICDISGRTIRNDLLTQHTEL